MSKYRTVAEMCEQWASATINPEADVGQVREMELAFYSGVWALINHMMVVGGDETMTEDEGAQHFENMRVEVRAHLDLRIAQMEGRRPPDGEVHH